VRELIAILVCFAAVSVAVGSSLVFAARHNATVPAADIHKQHDQTTIAQSFPSTVAISKPLMPIPASPASTSAPTATPGTIVSPMVPTPGQEPGAAGRESFKSLGCSTCHSIASAGNPRHPLDDVGSRWNAEQLRAWITGSGFAAERLPASVVGRKQRYTSIPPEQMDTLIAFLSGLKADQRGK